MPSIRLRRDRASDWSKANPVLGNGEPGYETDTGKMKIGDGDTRWNDLNYFVRDPTLENLPVSQQDLTNHVNADEPHPVYDDGPSLMLLYQNAKA